MTMMEYRMQWKFRDSPPEKSMKKVKIKERNQSTSQHEISGRQEIPFIFGPLQSRMQLSISTGCTMISCFLPATEPQSLGDQQKVFLHRRRASSAKSEPTESTAATRSPAAANTLPEEPHSTSTTNKAD